MRGKVEPVLVTTAVLDALSPEALLAQQEAALNAAAASYARLLADNDDYAASDSGLSGAAGGGPLTPAPVPSDLLPPSSSPSMGALFGLPDRPPSGGTGSLGLTPSNSAGSMLAAAVAAAAAGGGSVGVQRASSMSAARSLGSTASTTGTSSAAAPASAAAAPPSAAAAGAALSVLSEALLFGAAAVPPAAAQLDAASLLGRGTANIAAHASAHPLARRVPSHRVAELALAAARRAAGLWPAWPRALVPVTGCANPEADPRAAELLPHLAQLAAAAAVAP